MVIPVKKFEDSSLNMPEPVSVVIATVVHTAVLIKKWIDETQKKEETILNISQTVQRVSNILQTLSAGARVRQNNDILASEILCLGSALNKTLEHLFVWSPRKFGIKKVISFVNPSTVTEILREDERNINQQIIMVLFMLSTLNYLQTTENECPAPNALNWIKNEGVAKFWEDHVGREVTRSISLIN